MRRLVTAAVLLVVSAPLLSCTSDGSASSARPESVARVVETDVGLPDPAAGLRWVVAGGVAFMVPSTWADTDLGCEYHHDRPSVVYDTTHWSFCQRLDPFDRAASVQLLDDERSHGVSAWRRRARVPLSGLEASRSPMLTKASGKNRVAVVLGDTRQVVLVESTDQAEVEAIVASMRSVPDGVVVVPEVDLFSHAEAEVRLETAGLEVDVREAASPYEVGRVVGADPPVGAPVAPGTRVMLDVSAGPDGQLVSDRRLQGRLHVTFSPVGDEAPGVTEKSIRRSAYSWRDGKATQVLLRRVTATGGYLRDHAHLDGELVWIVLQPDTLQTGMGQITVRPRPVVTFRSDFYGLYRASNGEELVAGTI